VFGGWPNGNELFVTAWTGVSADAHRRATRKCAHATRTLRTRKADGGGTVRSRTVHTAPSA